MKNHATLHLIIATLLKLPEGHGPRQLSPFKNLGLTSLLTDLNRDVISLPEAGKYLKQLCRAMDADLPPALQAYLDKFSPTD